MVTRISGGEEHVIVRGLRSEEQLWGAYPFPCPYRLDDRIVVSGHVTVDVTAAYPAPTGLRPQAQGWPLRRPTLGEQGSKPSLPQRGCVMGPRRNPLGVGGHDHI